MLVVEAVLQAVGADIELVNVLFRTTGFTPPIVGLSAAQRAALAPWFKKAVPL